MPDSHGGRRCPRCSSTFVRRLRLGRWERLKAMFTERRPHGCWHCGWHGWVPAGAGTQEVSHRADPGRADAVAERNVSPSRS